MVQNGESFYGGQMDQLDDAQYQISDEPESFENQVNTGDPEIDEIRRNKDIERENLLLQNQILRKRLAQEQMKIDSQNEQFIDESAYHRESNRGGFYGNKGYRNRHRNNIYPDGSHYGDNANGAHIGNGFLGLNISLGKRGNNYENHGRYNHSHEQFGGNHHQHDYHRGRESLPHTVSPKIIGGSVYFNGNIGKDYYKKLDEVGYSNNLINGLSPNENGYIELNFGNRIERIDVVYDSGYVIFNYNGYSQSILLSKGNYNKIFLVNFGDNIPEHERGQTHGKFLEFEVNLDFV